MSFLNSDRKKDCDTGQNSTSTFLIWQLYAFGRQGQQLIRESVAGGAPHLTNHLAEIDDILSPHTRYRM